MVLVFIAGHVAEYAMHAGTANDVRAHVATHTDEISSFRAWRQGVPIAYASTLWHTAHCANINNAIRSNSFFGCCCCCFTTTVNMSKYKLPLFNIHSYIGRWMKIQFSDQSHVVLLLSVSSATTIWCRIEENIKLNKSIDFVTSIQFGLRNCLAIWDCVFLRNVMNLRIVDCVECAQLTGASNRIRIQRIGKEDTSQQLNFVQRNNNILLAIPSSHEKTDRHNTYKVMRALCVHCGSPGSGRSSVDGHRSVVDFWIIPMLRHQTHSGQTRVGL